MTLVIGGKEYTIKYSVQATLCEECVERVVDLMARFDEASSDIDNESQEQRDSKMRYVVRSISGLAPTTLAMLYGGLLQCHGRRGDRTIMSKDDAEDLLLTYMEEHADDGEGDMYTLMEKLMGQMQEDNFFDKIGLGKMGEKATQAEGKVAPIRKAGRPASTKR